MSYFLTIIMLLPFFLNRLEELLVQCSFKDLVLELSHLIGHLMDIHIAFLERRSASQENSRESFIISWQAVRFANPPFVIQALGFFFWNQF